VAEGAGSRSFWRAAISSIRGLRPSRSKTFTIVPIANVGVVIAYIGRVDRDVTDDAFNMAIS
jgi:hypothetical protein